MTTIEAREEVLKRLDEAAYRVSENPAFGNKANWFLAFRRGTAGILHRRWAADHHYDQLTAWFPIVIRRNYEYDLASCLFGMDSAFECWVYTLNSLGWAISPSEFLSVDSATELKRIGPENILGVDARLLPGFAALFPTVEKLWRDHEPSIRTIMANHDVSKHRSATFSGGTLDMHPPPHIQSAGVPSGAVLFGIAPMKSVLLPRDPKLPLSQRPSDLAHWCDLKELKAAFDYVMNSTPQHALGDLAAWQGRLKP